MPFYLKPACFLLVFSVLIGCSSHSGRDAKESAVVGPYIEDAKGKISLKITFASRTQSRAKLAAIDIVRALIYSGEEELLRQDMDISDGRFSGEIVITAQNDLRVALVFFDGPLVRWIGEANGVNVLAGETVEVEIIEEFMGIEITQQTPESVDADSTYTISWENKAPYAIEYELQEASLADFSDSSLLNTWSVNASDTSLAMEAKLEGGVSGIPYFYRARVNTDYGIGPWYSTGWDSVVEPTGGILQIDGEIPPDEPL